MGGLQHGIPAGRRPAILALTAAMIIFATPVARLLFPALDPGDLEAVVRLTRIVLPAQIFFVVGSLFMAAQYVRRRFLIPALAPVIYNLGIICGGLLGAALGEPETRWVHLGRLGGSRGRQLRAAVVGSAASRAAPGPNQNAGRVGVPHAGAAVDGRPIDRGPRRAVPALLRPDRRRGRRLVPLPRPDAQHAPGGHDRPGGGRRQFPLPGNPGCGSEGTRSGPGDHPFAAYHRRGSAGGLGHVLGGQPSAGEDRLPVGGIRRSWPPRSWPASWRSSLCRSRPGGSIR